MTLDERRKTLARLVNLLGDVGFEIRTLTENDNCDSTTYGITGCLTQKLLNGGNISVVPTAKRILKSGDRTIVFWDDGTKTIVKRADGTQDSNYNAYLAALGKKIYGTTSALKRIVARTEVQEQKKQKNQK